MSNDFINRRQIDDRRKRRTGTGGNGGGGTNPTPGTFIRTAHIVPEWNTYIRMVAPVVEAWPGGVPPSTRLDAYLDRGATFDHWSSINHVGYYDNSFGPLTGIGIPYLAKELPVALFNNWCDHGGKSFATIPGSTLIPRTPTRSLLAFNMSGVPTGANILSADLSLTVSGSSFWVTQQQIQTNRIQRDPNKNFLNDDVWVAFQFDGSGVTSTGDEPLARAHGWGGGRNTFSWSKFLELRLFGIYNPVVNAEYDGSDTQPLNPWSLRKWYEWGARQFHLHMPFGRPAQNLGPESLAYQADAFLCARDGFTGIGADPGGNPIPTQVIQYNTAMPWLTNDFVSVWSSLITGVKHQSLPDADWNRILTWYNPSSPIRVIAYNGAITFYTLNQQNQYTRWNQQFQGTTAALKRLQDSVQPFIDCGMQIGIDALASAPGPVPGTFVATNFSSEFATPPGNYLNQYTQAAWWDFFIWLKDRIGITNIYCEAYPYRRVLTVSPSTLANPIKTTNPYLPYVQQGMGIMSNEEFSYLSYASFPDKHTFAELGDKCRYLRNAYWAGANTKLKTKRNESFPGSPLRSLPRYPDFDRFGVTWNDVFNRPATSAETAFSQGDRRFDQNDPNSGYGSIFMFTIAGRNLLDPVIDETEPVPGYNRTTPGLLIPNKMLQTNYVLGSTYTSAGYTTKDLFGLTFSTGTSFNNALRSYKTLSLIETHPLELRIVKGNPPNTMGWRNPLFVNDPGGTNEWNGTWYQNNALNDPYFAPNVDAGGTYSTFFPAFENINPALANTSVWNVSRFIQLVKAMGSTAVPGALYQGTNTTPILFNLPQGPQLRHESVISSSNFSYVGGLITDKRIPKVRFAVSPFDGDRNIINVTPLVQGHHTLPRQKGGNTLTVVLTGAGTTHNLGIGDLEVSPFVMTLDPYLEARPVIPVGEATGPDDRGDSSLSFNSNWYKTNSHIKFHSINSDPENNSSVRSDKIAFLKDFYLRGFAFNIGDMEGICQGYVDNQFVGATMEIHFTPSFNAAQVFSGISFGSNGLPVALNITPLPVARAGRITGPANPAPLLTSVAISEKYARMRGLCGNIAIFNGGDNSEFTYSRGLQQGNAIWQPNNFPVQYGVNPMRINASNLSFVPPGLSGFNLNILGNGAPNTNSNTILMTLKTGFTASAGVNNSLIGSRNLIAIRNTEPKVFIPGVTGPDTSIGIGVGSYIRVSGSGNDLVNDKVYRVIATYPVNPTIQGIVDTTFFDYDPYQYIEVDSEVTGLLEGVTQVTVDKIDRLPILTVKYLETVP